MKGLRIVSIILTALVVICPPLQAMAQTYVIDPQDIQDGFTPSAILDDSDIFDLGNMTQDKVQDFLSSKGTLGRYRTQDIDGVEKSAAQIIWRVATSYKVNPRYLMALMQKEQSLVEDPSPTQKQFDWATGYGVCDSCSMSDPSIQQFKGFANQLEWAAKQYREKYLLQLLGRGTTAAGYAVGRSVNIDGVPVTPINMATAMLYSYTPHIHGNLSLWHIWRRWFSLTFPDGTVVQANTSKTIYLIRFGVKRAYKSRAAAYSMIDPNKIVTADDAQLSAYPDGNPIPFANYSLVETTGGKRYLIVGDKKRLIVSRKVFLKLGFNEDEVVQANDADLQAYDDGPDITAQTSNPTGLLAKDAKGAYWYIEDGVRHLIPHRTFLTLYFPGQPAKLLTTKKLETYTLGDPYQLHDGELVRSKESPSVYVIENGKRRPIVSGDVFGELGWKWNNVVTIPANVLSDYALGDPVEAHAPPVVLADNTASTDANATTSAATLP